MCFCGIFSKFKTEFYCISFFYVKCRLVQIAIFEIHQLWQSDFCRVYSNSGCRCSFEIKIGQSSHKMYSNKILNSQESTTILNACTKTSWNLLNTLRIYIYIYIYISFDLKMRKGETKVNFVWPIRYLYIYIYMGGVGWLCFTAYQPLYMILCQFLSINIYETYMICKQIHRT